MALIWAEIAGAGQVVNLVKGPPEWRAIAPGEWVVASPGVGIGDHFDRAARVFHTS